MKNKFILLVAVCLAVFSLAACSGSSEKTTTAASSNGTDQGQTQATSSGAATAGGYIFTYKGAALSVGGDASVIDQLGEYKDKSETASCAFEGLDTQYFYGSFYVTVGTTQGKDVITAFWFVDDTIETDEGLCIGDPSSKVEELYGADGFNGTNAYTYEKDLCKLIIIIEDDTVSSISYVYNK